MKAHRYHIWTGILVGLSALLPACAATPPVPESGYVRAWSYVGRSLDPFWWRDRVDVQGARDKGLTGAGTKVAIVDTGMATPHEDLLPSHRIDGVEFCSGNETADTNDTNGHGTQLAGIVLARDPGDSTRGVAPDAALIPFKVVCAVTKAVAVARGVQSAVGATPDVILLALGGWPADTDPNGNDVNQLLTPLVSVNSNILFVIASVWEPKYAQAPTWTTYPNVIVVAGMTLDDTMKKEVPFNEKRGDIWAPAQGVGTASITLVDPKDPTKHVQFLMPGTSAASAIVAGCAALIKEKYPAYNGQKVKETLLKAVLPQADLPGGGRLKCSMAFP